jgi:hypothetical protein
METDDEDAFSDAMAASNPSNGFQVVNNSGGKRQRRLSDEVIVEKNKKLEKHPPMKLKV